MRKYRLIIRQIKEIENPEIYLLQLLKDDTDCTEVLTEPSRKSIRKMPKPGIKWIKGKITLQDSDCRYDLNMRCLHNEYFKIKLKRIK